MGSRLRSLVSSGPSRPPTVGFVRSLDRPTTRGDRMSLMTFLLWDCRNGVGCRSGHSPAKIAQLLGPFASCSRRGCSGRCSVTTFCIVVVMPSAPVNVVVSSSSIHASRLVEALRFALEREREANHALGFDTLALLDTDPPRVRIGRLVLSSQRPFALDRYGQGVALTKRQGSASRCAAGRVSSGARFQQAPRFRTREQTSLSITIAEISGRLPDQINSRDRGVMGHLS
jgi:hypothetical protein